MRVRIIMSCSCTGGSLRESGILFLHVSLSRPSFFVDVSKMSKLISVRFPGQSYFWKIVKFVFFVRSGASVVLYEPGHCIRILETQILFTLSEPGILPYVGYCIYFQRVRLRLGLIPSMLWFDRDGSMVVILPVILTFSFAEIPSHLPPVK